MHRGIVSATFRNLLPEEVIKIALDNGLDCIEWSGDRHVPIRNIPNALHVKRLSDEAGLKIVTYGSYFRVCETENLQEEFADTLETALALGTDNIRIWAGTLPSEAADDEYFARFITETEIIADMAKKENVKLSFEYHKNTLTDNFMVSMDLIDALNKDNVFINWQPNQTTSILFNLYELRMLIKYILNVHVFYRNTQGECRPLIEGTDDWRQYCNILKNKDRAMLMEFVADDDVDQFKKDCDTFKSLI